MYCLQFQVPMHTTNHKHLINCNPRFIPPSNQTQRCFAFRLHAWLCGIIMYGYQVGWSHGYGIVELHGDLLMCMDVWRNGYVMGQHGTLQLFGYLWMVALCTTLQPYDYTWLYGNTVMTLLAWTVLVNSVVAESQYGCKAVWLCGVLCMPGCRNAWW